MKMHCPHCGVNGSADDSYIGRKVRCPKCQKVFRCGDEQQPAALEPDFPSLPTSRVDEDLFARVESSDVFQKSADVVDVFPSDEEPPSGEEQVVIPEEESLARAPEQDQVPELSEIDRESVPVDIPPVAVEVVEKVAAPDDIDISGKDADVDVEIVSPEQPQEVMPVASMEEVPVSSVETVELAEVEESVKDESGNFGDQEIQSETGEETSPPAVEPALSAVPQSVAAEAVAGSAKIRAATVVVPAPGKKPHPEFTVGEALTEAWQRTKGAKGTVWAAMGVTYLVILIVGLGLVFLQKSSGLAPESVGEIWLGIGVDTLNSVVSTLFSAGLMYIGVCLAAGKSCSWKMVIEGFPAAWPLLVATILMTLLIISGLVMLILPGIYLAVGYAMTLPLILDRRLGPWEAMEKSRKAIHKVWWKVFGLFLIMGFITVVSAVPLGIGLIWTLPMNVVLCGVVYRYLFGIQENMR